MANFQGWHKLNQLPQVGDGQTSMLVVEENSAAVEVSADTDTRVMKKRSKSMQNKTRSSNIERCCL